MKVLDASRDISGRFAAKLFAMGGAEVVRLTLPGETPGAGWLDRYVDAGKRRVDAASPEAIALASEVDLAFTSFDRGALLAPGAGIAARLRDDCVHVTTSTFGMTGPYASLRGGPASAWSAGGYLAITGDPGRAPLMGPERVCEYVGGYTAAIGAEAALRDRARTGRGRRLDISAMESMACLHQSTFCRAAIGQVRQRTGRYSEVYPLTVKPCATGHVSIGVVTDPEFDRLMIAIGRPELSFDERFKDTASRWANRDAIDEVLDPFFLAHDAAEVLEQLQATGVPSALVADPLTVLENPQLAHRGFWAPAEGGARAPGNPIPKAKIYAKAASPRPALDRPVWELAPRPGASLPLSGVRVLDVTAFWAGPSTNRTLGDLGADVIWIERPGARVAASPGGFDPSGALEALYQWKMNRHKRSVVIDLDSPAGRAAARALAMEADVLVENFRPGVAERLGLGPAELCAANPGLVYVSLSGFGHDGPWRDRRSYGPTIEAASSVMGRTGYAGGDPLRLGHTLPDGVGGLVGALAALRGLRERDERGGVGGWYDVSQLEGYAALSGEDILRASAEQAWSGRVGNRSREGAVQGVFPCQGDDQWVVLRLDGPDDLQRFAAATGIDLPPDPAAAKTAIAAFTETRDKGEVARLLQAAGIEALPVFTPPELMADPQLAARGFFAQVEVGGRVYPMPGAPYRAEPPVADSRGRAPAFGEHSAWFRERLADTAPA